MGAGLIDARVHRCANAARRCRTRIRSSPRCWPARSRAHSPRRRSRRSTARRSTFRVRSTGYIVGYWLRPYSQVYSLTLYAPLETSMPNSATFSHKRKDFYQHLSEFDYKCTAACSVRPACCRPKPLAPLPSASDLPLNRICTLSAFALALSLQVLRDPLECSRTHVCHAARSANHWSD